jgi:alpha/beta hydrolase fold
LSEASEAARRATPEGASIRFQIGRDGTSRGPVGGYWRTIAFLAADYRLQPRVTLADQVADVRDAIAWLRAHAAEFGAGPGTLFVAGSSAGAYFDMFESIRSAAVNKAVEQFTASPRSARPGACRPAAR